MSDSSSLNGRVALITGMSRGLGAQLAERFWAAGANIFGAARDLAALQAVAARLARAPVRPDQRVAVMSADLAHPAAPAAIVQRCIDEFGCLEVLVSNAAVQGPIGKFWELDLSAWEQTVSVDLLAGARLAHAAIPAMLQAPAGRRSILFLSGGGATASRPRFTAYATAKTGLARFAETLAAELIDTPISVNCISPGAMPTSMLAEVVKAGADRAGAGEVAAFDRARSAGEATMQRTAALAVFLATDGAGITGKLIAAQWDRWEDWPEHLDELRASDVYTLRRIAGRDRNIEWGDK